MKSFSTNVCMNRLKIFELLEAGNPKIFSDKYRLIPDPKNNFKCAVMSVTVFRHYKRQTLLQWCFEIFSNLFWFEKIVAKNVLLTQKHEVLIKKNNITNRTNYLLSMSHGRFLGSAKELSFF